MSEQTTERDHLFLSLREAHLALCFDFRHYEPQLLLFCELIRLMSDGTTLFRREADKNGLWISQPGRRKMRWIEGFELVEYMCQEVSDEDLSPDMLAAICSRVFRTRATPAEHPDTEETGIRIDTGMESFRCRQCGQCCRNLDYRDALTEEDVKRLEAIGRHDVLVRVGKFKPQEGKPIYRIWMTPGKLELEEECPFLKKIPTENRWVCMIHDVKPTICRQYPVSRKHANMTGCPGFDNKK